MLKHKVLKFSTPGVGQVVETHIHPVPLTANLGTLPPVDCSTS
jgi:hypothetical protein